MQTTAIIRSLLVWALVAHAAPAPAPRRRDDLVPTVTDTGTDPANPDELVQIDTTSATQGYCHNFLDPTTNNALVYDQIDCWLNGTQVSVWDFGSRSQASDKDPNAVAVNPIYYPVYPSGISAGAPVIDRVPCDDGYSDVWLKIKVTVQRRTVYNSFKEISAFDPYALFTGKVEGVTNMPIVPKGSILTGYDDVKFTTAWYKGRRVTLVDLGIIQKTKKTIKKLIPYQEVDILDENFNTEAMILENGIANSPNSFYVRNSLENLTFTPTSFDQIANLSFVPLADVFFFNYPIVVNTTTSTTTTTTTTTSTTTTSTATTTTTTTVEIASETETPSPAVHSTEEHNSVQPETKSTPIKSAQITETFPNAWLPTGTEVPVKVPESNQPESRTIQNPQSVYITAERTNEVTEKPLLVTETFKVPIKPTQIPQPSAGQIDVEPTKTGQQPGAQHSVYIVTEWIPDTTEAPLVFSETVKVPVKPTQVPEPSNGQIDVEPTKTSQQLGQHSVYIVTEWIPDTTEVPLVVTETVKVPVKPTIAPEPSNGQIDVSPTKTSQQPGGPHSVYIVTEWVPDTTEAPLQVTETVKVPVKPTQVPQPSDGQVGVEPTKTAQQSAGQHSVYIVTEWIPDTTEVPLLVTETVKVPIKPTQIPQPSNGNIDVETTKTVQQTAHHSVYIVTEWIPDTTEVPVIATETVKVPVNPTEAPQPSNGQIGVEPTKTVQQPSGQHSKLLKYQSNQQSFQNQPMGRLMYLLSQAAAKSSIMKGYFKQPELTKEILTDDGWLMTGDIAEMNKDGTLQIIDRKKNLVKLANGEYIALEKLESNYKTSKFVQNICVHADSEQSYAVALIQPIEKEIRTIAAPLYPDTDINSVDYDELCRRKEVRDAVLASLKDVAKKVGFKPAEIVGQVFICHEEWTPQNGLLTAAMKLQRKQIINKYAQEVRVMYSS
ncbi:long-chain fatty acid-CoA ligase [Rhizoclosmatium sp. JEL0117]|nr:long-chain fatty acid-CoA ligase [Rhizoclosmatium sp. JEL0117]